MQLTQISIKGYRSIQNLSIKFEKGFPVILCGANNVGKTNILRAIKLFFDIKKDNFDFHKDVPYEIVYGSRGARAQTIIIGQFVDDNNKKIVIQSEYSYKNETTNIKISGKIDGKKIDEKNCENILSNFKCFFIESSNVNLPDLISEIVETEMLDVGLKGRKEAKALAHFTSFIKEATSTLNNIAKDLKPILTHFVTDKEIDGSNGREVGMKLPEVVKLREALTNLVEVTLFDKNKSSIDTKGSGIQRILYLSIMTYIANQSEKNIIWCIDEPESYLQPSLQKKIRDVIRNIAGKHTTIFSTHSHYLIDIHELKSTNVISATFIGKEYARKPNQKFFQTKTEIIKCESETHKANLIKEHFGISNSDAWILSIKNLLVEGEEDRNYIYEIFAKMGISKPNILVGGGVDRYPGYLNFLDLYSSGELKPIKKPIIIALFDHDHAGRSKKQEIESKKNQKNIEIETMFIERFDGENGNTLDYELEDFIFPELLLESIIEILKEKEYKIKKSLKLEELIKTRKGSAYNHKSILELITQLVGLDNPSSPPINFEEQGIKIYISSKVIKKLKEMKQDDFDNLMNKYPEVKKFIEILKAKLT